MIRLQFSRQAGIASGAIAWFSSGNLSHVDAMLPDGSLLGARSDAVGGQPPGVRIRPQGYAKFAVRVIMEIPCGSFRERTFYAFLHSQKGKPYDKKAIWAFVANRNWRDQDSWICSELQASAGEVAGIWPKLYLAANKITPVALALVASAVKGRIVELETHD